MKYAIGEKCIQCFACIRNRVCPEEAIIERAGVYSIDPEKCTDCGQCFRVQQYFCPVRAIVEKENSPRDESLRDLPAADGDAACDSFREKKR